MNNLTTIRNFLPKYALKYKHLSVMALIMFIQLISQSFAMAEFFTKITTEMCAAATGVQGIATAVGFIMLIVTFIMIGVGRSREVGKIFWTMTFMIGLSSVAALATAWMGAGTCGA